MRQTIRENYYQNGYCGFGCTNCDLKKTLKRCNKLQNNLLHNFSFLHLLLFTLSLVSFVFLDLFVFNCYFFFISVWLKTLQLRLYAVTTKFNDCNEAKYRTVQSLGVTSGYFCILQMKLNDNMRLKNNQRKIV